MSSRVTRRVAGRWRRACSLAMAALLGVGLIAAQPGAAPAAETTAQPNIVVIMTDDQEMASLSEMTNVRNLITEHGTRFAKSFASYPLCCPSRATFLTGQLPHNHDVLDNKGPYGGYGKLREAETLPVWLGRAGYHTVHIGKYLNGYGNADPTRIPPGWQEWHGLVGSSTYRMWGYSVNNNGVVRQYGKVTVEDPALYQTDVLRKMAVDYIDRQEANDARPFFLSWAPLAPHTESYTGAGQASRNPRPAPRHFGRYAEKNLPRPPSFNEPNVSDKPAHISSLPLLTDTQIAKIRKRYRSKLESLLAVDEAVAAIVNRLAANGELANTLIIFTSDNGILRGQHRIGGGKIHAYDPSAKVPLVIRGPGFPANVVRHAMVSNVDVPATILEAAGATPSITIDGLSLRTIANNPSSVAGRHLLIETGEPGGRAPGDLWYRAVRTSRYLYVEHWTQLSDGSLRHRGKELYDQSIDPHQLSSKRSDPSYDVIREQLATRLAQLKNCTGANCSGL